mgnify:CR=1 FL=1
MLMSKERKITVFLAVSAPSFIAAGMALKQFMNFAPLVGRLACLAAQVTALMYALKAHKK